VQLSARAGGLIRPHIVRGGPMAVISRERRGRRSIGAVGKARSKAWAAIVLPSYNCKKSLVQQLGPRGWFGASRALAQRCENGRLYFAARRFATQISAVRAHGPLLRLAHSRAHLPQPSFTRGGAGHFARLTRPTAPRRAPSGPPISGGANTVIGVGCHRPVTGVRSRLRGIWPTGLTTPYALHLG